MQPELYLIGAGGFAKDFIACFSNEYHIKGCWDDQLPKGSQFNRLPVLGNIGELLNSEGKMTLVVTVASPVARSTITQKLSGTKHSFPALIHPAATLFDVKSINVGTGSIIFPSAILTTQINLGNFTIVHIAASVHHNVTVGDCSVIMPGARLTGDVIVGKNVFIGPNQVLSHGTDIPDGTRLVNP